MGSLRHDDSLRPYSNLGALRKVLHWCSAPLTAVACLLTGCLEGLEHTANLVAKQRQTFTEQTQEDLYTTTQAAKSANKKGLGTSSDPRAPSV